MPRKKRERQEISNVPAVQEFFDDHGDFVKVPDSTFVLFEDGAKAEFAQRQVGVMMPPPTDDYERLQLIEEYFAIKANAAIDRFASFREYLLGNGVGVVGVESEEEKIAHLRKLKAKASTARRRYSEARRARKEKTPFWMETKRKEKQEEQRSKSNFHKKVKSIQL